MDSNHRIVLEMDQISFLVPIRDFQVNRALLAAEQGDLELKGGSLRRRFVRRHGAETRQIVESALDSRERNRAAVVARQYPSTPLLPNGHTASVSRDANLRQRSANPGVQCNSRRTCWGQNDRPHRVATSVMRVRLTGAAARVLFSGTAARRLGLFEPRGFLEVAAQKQCRAADGRHEAPVRLDESALQRASPRGSPWRETRAP